MRKQLVSATMVVVVLFVCFSRLEAQVTVGANTAPDSNAVLDLKSNNKWGLLLPRVKLLKTNDSSPLSAHVAGMVVYNIDSAGIGTSTAVVPSYYYNDGKQWVRIMAATPQWFYMPSFNLPLAPTPGTSMEYNLYTEYAKQFQKSGNNQFLASAGASDPTKVRVPYLASELEFFVTAYSDDVITVNNLDANGILYYTTKTDVAPNSSFINVIFKVK